MTRALLLAALALTMGGCAPAETEPDEVWTVRGIFEAPVFEGEAARVTHEAIPGLMDAMRMEFLLETPGEVDDLAPGTPIEFELTWTAGQTRARRFRVLPDTVTLDLPSPD